MERSKFKGYLSIICLSATLIGICGGAPIDNLADDRTGNAYRPPVLPPIINKPSNRNPDTIGDPFPIHDMPMHDSPIRDDRDPTTDDVTTESNHGTATEKVEIRHDLGNKDDPLYYSNNINKKTNGSESTNPTESDNRPMDDADNTDDNDDVISVTEKPQIIADPEVDPDQGPSVDGIPVRDFPPQFYPLLMSPMRVAYCYTTSCMNLLQHYETWRVDNGYGKSTARWG